ncbi:hypothetical protein JD974_12595 [Chromobacterium haemolyticum]|uniref:Morphogenetic protein n=1 Tax=Chromobacterium haemolyticum TaxID=394935 RepID=A0ABS3GPL7_9NEIS|nr:hypothetical protein [Chromobacterium haemolyticum]MBK0415245.1 hypothetical protein [Chromobacterium haemolyticum]MBO0416540.1 hypothetical protein [Chromobacterium haemolyticum]MBO0499884.1 hypothetical protein [Chromobacterium haemolyticum]
MKERPILFSGEMIRALLAGTKTQTRRVIKFKQTPCMSIEENDSGKLWPWREDCDNGGDIWYPCPYGQPGDRLWVRETWGVISHSWNEKGEMVDWKPDRPATAIHELPFGKCYYSGHVIYAADGPNEWSDDDDGGGEPRSLWHPSIHMPRAASRILLQIANIRVERLQDISESDVIAEGCPSEILYGRGWYRDLWEELHGAGSWEANPWVWVIEFEKLEA